MSEFQPKAEEDPEKLPEREVVNLFEGSPEDERTELQAKRFEAAAFKEAFAMITKADRGEEDVEAVADVVGWCLSDLSRSLGKRDPEMAALLVSALEADSNAMRSNTVSEVVDTLRQGLGLQQRSGTIYVDGHFVPDPALPTRDQLPLDDHEAD